MNHLCSGDMDQISAEYLYTKRNTISSSVSEEDYMRFSDIFCEISLDYVSQTDAAVSYYVSDYIL